MTERRQPRSSRGLAWCVEERLRLLAKFGETSDKRFPPTSPHVTLVAKALSDREIPAAAPGRRAARRASRVTASRRSPRAPLCGPPLCAAAAATPGRAGRDAIAARRELFSGVQRRPALRLSSARPPAGCSRSEDSRPLTRSRL